MFGKKVAAVLGMQLIMIDIAAIFWPEMRNESKQAYNSTRRSCPICLTTSSRKEPGRKQMNACVAETGYTSLRCCGIVLPIYQPHHATLFRSNGRVVRLVLCQLLVGRLVGSAVAQRRTDERRAGMIITFWLIFRSNTIKNSPCENRRPHHHLIAADLCRLQKLLRPLLVLRDHHTRVVCCGAKGKWKWLLLILFGGIQINAITTVTMIL